MASLKSQVAAGLLIICSGLVVLAALPSCAQKGKAQAAASAPVAANPDAIVVGAGISGLSAALELAEGGAKVVVIDMSSIFGGHAVMATGDLNITGTPFQEAMGLHDTPEIAFQDFMSWGEDPNPDWVRYYVNHGRHEVYDWLTEMGVTFESMGNHPGNTVRRTHRTKGRGLGLVSPIYNACLRNPNIAFVWNTRIDRLLVAQKHLAGVAATNLRTNAPAEFHAGIVVLATGGFQSNLDLVRQFWRSDLPFPEHFLIGSGINSVGSGLKLAQDAGAAVSRLDHQWNYISGLPDPRFPGSKRGLNARNTDSIWVNADGKRFIAEGTSAKYGLPVLLRQKGEAYWSVFDENSKKTFWVAGSDWGDFKEIERLIFANSDIVKTASSIEELARLAGLPPDALAETVRHYNEMTDQKVVYPDFPPFGPEKPPVPKKVLTPPFYAVKLFPLTRKSMGGVVIDQGCRVLDATQQVIPGLYAVGELSGLAGINGKNGLEGTFLGPSIVTGRVAGRTALADLGRSPGPGHGTPPPAFTPIPPNPAATTPLCLTCHDLPKLTAQTRPGYWHFEKVHGQVLAEKYDCIKCHAEVSPTFLPEGHSINRLAQLQTCAICHKGEDR